MRFGSLAAAQRGCASQRDPRDMQPFALLRQTLKPFGSVRLPGARRTTGRLRERLGPMRLWRALILNPSDPPHQDRHSARFVVLRHGSPGPRVWGCVAMRASSRVARRGILARCPDPEGVYSHAEAQHAQTAAPPCSWRWPRRSFASAQSAMAVHAAVAPATLPSSM